MAWGTNFLSSFRSFFRLAKHFATLLAGKEHEQEGWAEHRLEMGESNTSFSGRWCLRGSKQKREKARNDAKGKFAEIFSCSGGWKLHYFYFFFPFTNCLFCCFLPFILLALLHPDWLTESSDFSTSCISSLCAYLAQFSRNCCGIAFQRMVRWTGTRWGAGGSDWWFDSSWASFCFSMQ